MQAHTHSLSIIGGGSLAVSAVNWQPVNNGRKYSDDMIETTGGGNAQNLQPYNSTSFIIKV